MALPKLYFENTIAAIYDHPDGYVLFVYHAGKRTRDQLQSAFQHTAILLETRRGHRILNDQRAMESFTAAETQQAATFWQERTHRWGHGITVASVLASDVFARLAATALRQELQAADISYRVFDNQQEAAMWLVKQTKAPPVH